MIGYAKTKYALLYTQIFQELYLQVNFNCGGCLQIHVTFLLVIFETEINTLKERQKEREPIRGDSQICQLLTCNIGSPISVL